MRAVVLFFLFFFSNSCFAQTSRISRCGKCDSLAYRLPHDTISTERESYCLLWGITYCSANVEFMEMGNEQLFNTLAVNPTIIIAVLEANAQFRKAAFTQIENPVKDFDIGEIIKAVGAAKGNKAIKQQIVAKLKIAGQKS